MSHELYNCGHLYDAASAHYLATGKRTLLEVALRSAALIRRVFGPDGAARHVRPPDRGDGACPAVPDHDGPRHPRAGEVLPGAEGPPRDPAAVHVRGGSLLLPGPPSRSRTAGGGGPRGAGGLHVLRNGGRGGAPARTRRMRKPSSRSGGTSCESKVYLTGGIGARHQGEAFGAAFELPNATRLRGDLRGHRLGHVEPPTLPSHRRFEVLRRDGADPVQRPALGRLPERHGVLLPQPARLRRRVPLQPGSAGRQPWFDVSCCPTSLCRFLPSLPGYVYATAGDAHLRQPLHRKRRGAGGRRNPIHPGRRKPTTHGKGTFG